jgi:hypothetical protein
LTLNVKMGQGDCSIFFCLKRRPIQWLSITTINLHFENLTYRTKNRWCSVDSQFQRQAGSVSIPLWPITAVWMSFINVWNESPCTVTMMRSPTLLTLRGAYFGMGISAIWSHSLSHSISIMVLWQLFCAINVLSPLLLHCSLMMHINIPFKIFFKVSANYR